MNQSLGQSMHNDTKGYAENTVLSCQIKFDNY